MQFKIKVCGMTSFGQVKELADMGVDYAGFIFYEKSPRFVGSKIKPQEIKQFKGLKKVGVFVNQSQREISNITHEYGLDLVQLHGDESPEFCEQLKPTVEVIKALRVTGNEPIEPLVSLYDSAADYFLFDTKAKAYGGTGKKFDWRVLANAKLSKSYFLSGGIGGEDASFIAEQASKGVINPFALDLNSKFESIPGVKKMDLVRLMLQNLENY